MDRQEAARKFLGLVQRYGLQWGVEVPRAAYELMNDINEVLNESDRRELVRTGRLQ